MYKVLKARRSVGEELEVSGEDAAGAARLGHPLLLQARVPAVRRGGRPRAEGGGGGGHEAT